MTRFFAYGTARQGGFHHAQLGLGEPVARLSLMGHRVTVAHAPGCIDPGCRHLHRMAYLCPGAGWAHGDVFAVDDAILAKLDALAIALGNYQYERREQELSDGAGAFTYRMIPPTRARKNVSVGLAEVVEHYTPHDELKACCVADPGHDGPHDVIDALDELRYADRLLRNLLRRFVDGNAMSMHVLEATAATTPLEVPLGLKANMAFIRHRDDIPALRAELARLLEEY